MDNGELKNVLAAAASPESEALNAIRAKFTHLPRDVADRFLVSEFGHIIREYLEKIPELKGLMIRSGNGASNFGITASQRLASYALMGELDAGLKWFDKVRATKRATALEVLPLWGIEVPSSVRLLDNVELVPFTALPDSSQKAGLASPDFGRYAAGASYTWSPPTAALVARWLVDPLFYQGESEPIKLLVGSPALLQRIVPLLAVVSPSSVIPSISWYQFDDPDLVDALLGAGHSIHVSEINPVELRSFGEFSPDVATEIVRKYVALDGEIGARLDRALNRFDRAMRRHSPEDAAVELAIALESLLVNEAGELTWKVGLRSALLFDGSKDEKLEARKIVRGVYRLRGMVVHTGSAHGEIDVQGLGKMKTQDLISKGAVVAASVIRATIRRGRIPDWFEAELSNNHQ